MLERLLDKAVTKWGPHIFSHREKAYLPLMAIMFLSFRWEFEHEEITWPIGLLLVGGGFFLRLWGQKHLRRRAPEKTRGLRVLTTSGPYAFMRNPLYVANILITVGFAVLSELLWMVPVSLVWLFAYYHLVVLCEERTLKERFGPGYRDYLCRVPRWVPRFSSPYNWKRTGISSLEALKAEGGTAFNIIMAAFLFYLKEMVDKWFIGGM